MKAGRLLLPTVLLAAACGTGSLPTTTSMAAPPTTPAPAGATTTVALPGTTTSPTEPAADPGLLAAIVLFPADLPAPYSALPLDPAGSGFRPAGASLSSAVEPQDEADDIVRFGLLGDFVTTYGRVGDLWVAVEAGAFTDEAGAAGYLADWQDDLARAAAAFATGRSDLSAFSPAADPTAADEAVRASYTVTYQEPGRPAAHGEVRVVRAGPVLAWVWAVGDDPAAVVGSLAPAVEERLLAVQAGDLLPRDPALLGLAEAPTDLLVSFTFEYSYGIDALPAAAGFRVTATGEFQGPDRTSCRLAYALGSEEETLSELVVLGTRVWLGGHTGYQEVPLRHPSALAHLPLCPGHPLFWQDTGFHRLPELPGTPDTIDGIAVLRSDLAGDPALLAALGLSPGRAARTTRYAVARAVDGGWVVEVEVEEEAGLAQARERFALPPWAAAEGSVATVFTRLRLSRPNDPSIEVEPPLTAG